MRKHIPFFLRTCQFWYNAMGIASPVIQCSSFSSDAHTWTPHLQHPIVTLHNGFNVSVVMRRKSISVIDHLKCGPLFQQRNVLAQRWNILTYSTLAPCSKSSWGDSGLLSHIHPIFVLLSMLNFQGYFHLSHHSAPCPSPSLSLHSVSPALAFPLVPLYITKKQVLYVSTQWPNEGGLGPDRRTKGKDKKKQQRDRKGEK